MRPLDEQALKQFVNLPVVNTHIVEEMLIIHFAVCMLALIMGYNQELSAIVLSPFLLCSIIIYIVGIKTKPTQIKRINLLMGLAGSLISVTCICSCFLIVPFQLINAVKLFLLLLFLNSVIILAMVWFAMSSVRRYKMWGAVGGTLGLSAALGGASLGRVFSKNIDVDIEIVLIICYAFLSCAFSLCFICIMRYYYANVLDKLSMKDISSKEK